MRAWRWGAGAIGLCWVLAGVVAASCGLDARKLSPRRIALDAGDGGAGGPALGPRLAVSPSGIDLGRVTTGFAARARVLVRNEGDAPLALPAIRLGEGSAPDFAIIQNRCESDVAPGQSCEVRIQVVPAQEGELRGQLQIESAAGPSGPNSAELEIVALGLAAGALVLAPLAGSFEDYGGVRLEDAEEGTFVLSNPSSAATGTLQIGVNRSEFTLLEPGEGDCVSGTTSLDPAGSCNVRLKFAPTERGPVDATLTIASDAAGSVSLTLAGRGLLPGVLETSTTALAFDGVLIGQSATRAASFANAGDEPLQLSGPSLEPGSAEGFEIGESDCSPEAPLEAGKSCRAEVVLRPPRAGEPLVAQLVVSEVNGAEPLGIPATGVGLLPGALEATPANEGDDAFGDVLLGETLERTLVIANPGAQPSGVLELSVSEGFQIVAPPAPGECVSGTTSLVDSQTCSVRVRFAPTEREAIEGALTVTSALLGAVALPVSGRGVVAGQIEVAPEINFGRVLTAASAQRPLTITNAGDRPLAPPTFERTGDAAQRAAFTVDSPCAAPVEPGEACEVTLSFAPIVAEPHAAEVKLTSGESTAAVLLLGEALAPGSLQLAPAPDSSAEFGDVAIGTSASRSFTLSNPGAVPSGALTITTDDNQFEADPGDCNSGDPAGLVDDASCTFSVVFTPTESKAAAANVSVQSPGAGRAGLQITGRGRTKPTLNASAAEKNLGRVVLRPGAPTLPENEFTWEISNGGDLATGPLVVTSDNPAEFLVDPATDQCSAVPLAGGERCQLVIVFRAIEPTSGDDAELRKGLISVQDPVGMGSVALKLEGTRLLPAGPGEACATNLDCAAGVCSLATCCDRKCEGPCEACGDGTCDPKGEGASCGTVAGAVCLGVDCKIPAGQPCGAAPDCHDGFCEPKLDAASATERVCCTETCAEGQGCNPAGKCARPRLQTGAPCAGPGDTSCADGLECKECLGSTQRQCTPEDECCNGCGGGFECIAGACQCKLVDFFDCNGTCIEVCPSDQECQPDAGQCGCRDPSLTLCDRVCVDTQSDEANCGACGNACDDGASCNGGACAAPGVGEPCPDGVCEEGGFCSNGVCCADGCETACEAVPADEACTAPPTASAPENGGACGADGQCPALVERCPRALEIGSSCGLSGGGIGSCQNAGDQVVCQRQVACVPSGTLAQPDQLCNTTSGDPVCCIGALDVFACGPGATCEGSVRAQCDSDEDCPTGNVCCYFEDATGLPLSDAGVTSNGGDIRCQPGGDCPQRLCASPQAANGAVCAEDCVPLPGTSAAAGWTVCP